MRPPGEIRAAILQAAADLAHEHDGRRHGPILRELAARAGVGLRAARFTVQNLTRAGRLQPVAQRKVEYRNRPVIEYAPARDAEAAATEYVDVASVFAMWAR